MVPHLPITLDIVRLEKHAEFVNLLQNLRTLRRYIVERICSGKQFESSTILISFKNAQKSIKNCLNDKQAPQLYQVDFTLHDESSLNTHTPTTKLKFNIKDELLSIDKDISFIELYQLSASLSSSGVQIDSQNLAEVLKIYHPVDEVRFFAEVDDLTSKFSRYLRSFEKWPLENEKFDYFLTDWDGTYKTYGSNYATCMQPAYSAVILNWVRRYLCKFVGILTAGPLTGPGILDLTALNPWDKINVGGSWGREWLLVDEKEEHNSKKAGIDLMVSNSDQSGTVKKTVLDKSCFDVNNEKLFEKLKLDIGELLKRDDFFNFSHVGSGFQQKVDRLTMAIQNVNYEVAADMIKKYVEELENIVKRLDPKGDIFEIQKAHLDIEIIVKDQLANRSWSKSDGLRLLTRHSPIPLDEHTRVLLCGDTVSDLPMLHFLRDERGVRPFVVFVNPTRELQDKLRIEMPHEETAQRLCVVGCPEVLHVALLRMINECAKSSMARI